jgi:hypothetical protein
MCLINDDEIRRVGEEGVAVTARLQVVDAANEMAVVLKDANITARQVALQPPHARRLNDHCFEAEFLAQLLFPLIAKVRRAKHGNSSDLAPIQKLPSDQASFDCLADTHVVGNQEPDSRLSEC